MSDPVNQTSQSAPDQVAPPVTEAPAPEAGAAPQPVEPEAAAAPSSHPAEARMQTLEQEIATLKDQLLRALAEAENFRRRAQREREDTAKFAVAGFARELLPVADNLRRALDSVPADVREGNDLLKTLAVGIEATERQLGAAFDRAGIRKQEPLGEAFDPNFHQVMFEIDGTGKPAGTVVQLLQAGYTINGRLLREAMVGVAKRGADQPASSHVDTRA